MISRGFKSTYLVLSLLGLGAQAMGQIAVPDRLANGNRMTALVTPADRGSLAYDSIPALPLTAGGKQTWWHRHGLFMDGPVQLTLDPVVDVSLDRRRTRLENGSPEVEKGHRNVRGVRYSGQIDNRIRFGGKVLEMQRLLVAPETEYVLAAQAYPGMGTGKLRPAEGGLYSMDHSLAEVWFDAKASNRIRLQWGLGSTGMGPGARNILWSDARAPAPFLLIEIDLGKGWQYCWVQSRQRGRMRLPANGAREGRYAPLGLSLRSLGKTFQWSRHQLDIHLVVARWTDVLERGEKRHATMDWALAMAPWSWPAGQNSSNPWYSAGHQGLDVQLRGQASTWYGQLRFSPNFDPRYAPHSAAPNPRTPQAMVGHVRHGSRWSFWTEWAPTAASTPTSFNPDLPLGELGIEPWSPLRNSWIQGAEWRVAGLTVAAEVGRTVQKQTSWKATVHIPTAAADVTNGQIRNRRRIKAPNRLWPALVPLAPMFSIMGIPGTEQLWWSCGVTSPVVDTKKSH